MTGGGSKYAEAADRFAGFYDPTKHGNKREFSALLGISFQNLNGYLSGKFDPLSLGRKLHALGMDLNYLATGIYTNASAPVETIPIEHKRILHQLQAHNLCTLGHITRLINIDETNRKLYNGVSVDEPEKHKPLPRQLVPKSEELFDGEPEKPSLPDWAAQQVKEKLEKKKTTHKHNAG